jgi:Carboxypeptidase regulatory-like domain
MSRLKYLLLVASVGLAPVVLGAAPPPTVLPASGDIAGTVTDSGNGNPIQGVEVTVQQGAAVVANAVTDPFGRFVFHQVGVGDYTVAAHFVGFRPTGRLVTVVGGQTVRVEFKLLSAPAELSEVNVTGRVPVSIDTRTGDQTFTQNDAHYTPTYTTSQVIQQSLAGAARAPTGEVHIRGQHAEYTYYIDGLPVTSGVSGSLNELFDPAVVQRIDFITGGWDAEWGEKSAAIINIQTRIPTGAFHATESTYFGSFNSLGQSLSMSANQGKWAEFISGSAQGTDMRQNPVESDKYNHPDNFSNHGDDYFGFAKVQYTASKRDIFTLDGNYSTSRYQIPYDSALGAVLHDHETDVNSFVNLGYRHLIGDAKTSEVGIPNEFFGGIFFRSGSLEYRPGNNDQPSFVDSIDDPSLTPRNVFEDRKFNTIGIKSDLGFPIVAGLADAKVGILGSYTYGHEDFSLTDPTGLHGPIESNTGLYGYDWAAYAETSIHPTEWFELRTGLRFNSHVAPYAPNQTQFSPRVRLNFFPDPSNTVYLYYGRTFLPTNIEDLRKITLQSGGGSDSSGSTLPERDNFYEVAYIHRFIPVGVILKLDGYWKDSKPGIDDNTIPGSSITTDINQGTSHVRGIEAVLNVTPPRSPLSGYVNFALNHGWADPPVSGGFFLLQQPDYTFDFDHDQRVSAVANLMYSYHQFYISTTGTYGSGLTNGISPTQADHAGYCTGLFCFNPGYHVHPNYTQELAAGYTILLGRMYIRPEFFMDNMWDAYYALKGAFYSGPSVGRPRSFTGKVTIGI